MKIVVMNKAVFSFAAFFANLSFYSQSKPFHFIYSQMINRLYGECKYGVQYTSSEAGYVIITGYRQPNTT